MDATTNNFILFQTGKRSQARVIYNTSLGVIFGVKKYADALWKVCEKRDIKVNLRTNLIQIQPDKRRAVFENLDNPDLKTTFEVCLVNTTFKICYFHKCCWLFQYEMLHVAPPMSTPAVLRNNKELTNEAGFLEISKQTLQHIRYPNIFGIGDCGSTPNSKTAAAAGNSIIAMPMKFFTAQFSETDFDIFFILVFSFALKSETF